MSEWKLVPVEPTEEMLRAAFAAMNATPRGTWKAMKAAGESPRRMFDVKMAPRYRAMLASAPQQSGGDSSSEAAPCPHCGSRLHGVS